MIIPTDEIGIADWLVNSIYPFENHVAGSVMPPNYEAYARILHPASTDSGNVTWKEIAKWSGRVYHPAMQFETIATPVLGRILSPRPWNGQVPNYLPRDQVKALAQLLSPFTETSNKMWYLVWEGHGDLPRSSQFTVEFSHRHYYLFRGDIDDIRDREIPEHHREPPDYWFPEDKSWCVATDIDLYWTYVGGSRKCIDAILRCQDLESVPAELTHGLTVESDIVNRLSAEEKLKWGV